MRFAVPVFCSFLLISCDPDPASPVPVTDLTQDTVQHDSSLAVVSDPIPLPVQDSVLFTASYTTSWCNGHVPSEEDIAEINTARRLYNMPLQLKNDETSHLITTDKKGRFKAVIPAGRYTIFLDEDANYAKSPLQVSCDLYFEREWGEVEIPADAAEARFTIKFPCDLCDEEMKRRP
jgi:hypothetical protein